MHNDYTMRSVATGAIWNPHHENISVYGNLSSAERIGAERGYAQGIADECRRSREKVSVIVRRLKLRGHPIEHIAEDTGLSMEEVSNL